MLTDNTTVGATGMSALFAAPASADFSLNPGQSLPKVARDARALFDFCGHPRSALTDIGPIDYGHPEAAACVAHIRDLYSDL